MAGAMRNLDFVFFNCIWCLPYIIFFSALCSMYEDSTMQNPYFAVFTLHLALNYRNPSIAAFPSHVSFTLLNPAFAD